MSSATKLAWQRKQRREFASERGYSTAADYSDGKIREQVLARDQKRCVSCGMTDEEHRAMWGRPITVDHKDKDRSHNSLDNLQTLCLRCHGRKDIIPSLTVPRVPQFKTEILERRERGETYQQIAATFGFSIASIWKWVRLWDEIGVSG